MDFVYIPAVFSVIMAISLILRVRNDKFKKMKSSKVGLLVCVMVIMMFSTYLIDSVAVLAYEFDLLELPYKTGVISHIRLNDRIGSPSTLILNDQEYDVDLKLVNNRKFFINRNYKVLLTPINKAVYKIIDLNSAGF